MEEDLLRLGRNLEQLHGPVAAQMFHHAATMLGGEMSFSRVIALFHLSYRGPQTITSLAKEVMLSHAATSRMVDSLFKAGLLDRQEGAADRRQKLVAITPAGRKCIDTFRSLTADAYARSMAELPLELRAGLSSLMEEVIRLRRQPPDSAA